MNYIYELEMKVRDYECDLQGIVNNANYQHYLEHTRHEFLTSVGISFAALHEQGVDPVVARINMAFKTPLKSGDEFVSKLYMKKEGIKYVFYQDIFRKSDNKVVVKSTVETVCVVNGRLSASGKGGVGKSTVSANLAVALAKLGYKVGLLDADIFGPSMPKMFQVEDARPYAERIDGRDMIIPVEKYEVKLLSIGFFVDPDQATLWRGGMASNALKQLIADAAWGELDYFLIDLPPGTSDIHLTVVQTLAMTGAIVVSTPQAVALADARKGINMFTNDKVNVPILGLVENMAWFTPVELPENKYYIFGKEGAKKLAEEMNVPLLGQIPIVQSICEGGDNGTPVALDEDSVTGRAFLSLAASVVRQVDRRNVEMAPTQIVEMHK